MPVTIEDVQRVREWECQGQGHSYSELEQFGVDGPVAVICTNCGKKWNVDAKQ